MARAKKQTAFSPLYVSFSSAADFLVALEKPEHPSWKGRGVRGCGEYAQRRFAGSTIEEFKQHLICNKELAESISAAGDVVALPTERRNVLEAHVCGCVPVVGAVLMGLPKQMLRTRRVVNRESILKLSINLTVHDTADMTAERINAAANKVAAVIAQLEQKDIRVELTVFCGYMGDRPLLMEYKVKEAGEQLDLFTMATPIADTAFFRLGMLSVQETMTTFVKGHGYILSTALLNEYFPSFWQKDVLYWDIRKMLDWSLADMVGEANDFIEYLAIDRYEN